MASISSLGIGSGLLDNKLLTDILTAEREATELRLKQRENRATAKISAYAEVRTALDTVSKAASSLADASLIMGTSASISDESVLAASTQSAARPGSYRIDVDRVASSHSLASKNYGTTTATVGLGQLTFTLGTTSYDEVTGDYDGFTQNEGITPVTIDITEENNTLTGVRDTINRDVKGVTASIVFDGNGYRLQLTSDETGENTSMQINANGDADLQALAYNGSQNDPANNMTETQKGADAVLRVNGLEITSSSNEVTEAIEGVTLNLLQQSSDTINLSISRNTNDVLDKMEEYVDAYNYFKKVYDEVNRYNPDEQDSAGLLLGETSLRLGYSKIRSSLNTIVDGLVGSDYKSLVQVGLEVNPNNDYLLEFDRATFRKAMNEDAAGMAGLLANQQIIDDPQIKYIAKGIDTKPGNYDIFIEQAATQARWQGLSAEPLGFASDLVIGGSNDEFQLALGNSVRDIKLEQGSYDNGDDLAQMIQNSINQAYAGSGKSVAVAFDADSKSLSITSSEFGSASTININNMDATLANTLGLTSATFGGVDGQSYSNLGAGGFGAQSLASLNAFDIQDGIDFSENEVQFDLTLTGTANDGTYTINLDEDWSDIVDTDGNVTTNRTRADALSYIQSEINNAGLAGVVTAEFNNNGRLVFRTEPEAGTQTLEVSNVSSTGTDPLGLQEGVGTSGVTLDSDAEFQLAFSNRSADVTSGTISVAAGTYETPEDLAAAIQTAINNDAAVQAGAEGARTTKGSRNLSGGVDFAADPAQFGFKLNGTDYTINVNSNGTNTLDSIQQAIDAELGAGVVTASTSGGGLVLTTDITGSTQQIEITSDGLGATTTAGSVDLSTGIDFSASPANFTLEVDGVNIDVTVDGDGTAGSNDAESNLAAIQEALDSALVSTGGEFKPGDIKARLDASNQLYFETVSKNGEPTEATFGADATIELKNADANAQSVLGLADQGPQVNGADGFGLSKGLYQGFDSQATVSYNVDEEGNGSFGVTFGNDTQVAFLDVNDVGMIILGFSPPLGDEADPVQGKDVKGTINGYEATGRGQYLTAQESSNLSTNGYLLGGKGAAFESAVVIDATNKSFQVKIDDVESGTIELTEGVYTSGDQMAAEMQRKINADLENTGKSVSVQYDEDTDTFGIISASKGEESTVEVMSIDPGLSDILAMTPTTVGVPGKEATEVSNDAKGMILKISGSQTGQRGSISLVDGIFSRMQDALDDMIGVSGSLTQREKSLDDEMAFIEEERSKLDIRMKAMEENLVSKFIFNDKLISQLQNTQSFLTQQFEAMNPSKD
ncbi:flagellar filament capping protein FliD [Saccharospirillum sp. HFRX-1]|uniref:flagellar filament capping protein FliD n=1 Tax=unclassified Saccharospirillum TaxID=2633430 RepID=UPI00372055AD